MTKRLCTFSGCNAVVDHPDDGTSPRCQAHPIKERVVSKAERYKRYKHHYDHNGNLIYKTKEWRKIRKARLLLNPLCQHHEKLGLVKPAEHVDHIVEIEDGGEPYSLDNTQSLCQACHNRKTAQEKAKRSKPSSRYKSLSDFN